MLTLRCFLSRPAPTPTLIASTGRHRMWVKKKNNEILVNSRSVCDFRHATFTGASRIFHIVLQYSGKDRNTDVCELPMLILFRMPRRWTKCSIETETCRLRSREQEAHPLPRFVLHHSSAIAALNNALCHLAYSIYSIEPVSIRCRCLCRRTAATLLIHQERIN